MNKSFLQAVRLERDLVKSFDEYPFDIPAVRHLQRLEFHPAVTFFIGENGSGKSTLLEAIATKSGFNAEGGSKNLQFATRETHSCLHDFIRLERVRYPTDGYFLRAESFYNVATKLDELGGFDRAYGGKSLHHQSHGEAFLALLQHRFQGHGLYLLDEPEAALSPQRQLSVLTLIHRLVQFDSQFVIATHSPILLAYPNARIYHFSEAGMAELKYEDSEHFQITRDFLNHRERMLELLLKDEQSPARLTPRKRKPKPPAK